ncbi:bifunctional 3-(3-hydroxy-phenyl)propionate/3-hydroxycinnamic acid hydroxylase [uncultured Ramlibacter sp.]|uniref:bifunctional 3-(3-hydroxy-phenyl)propionate/3-hydroxycinnamic acid hydroxylase n=1 Tax=uncultured Ramlibacter sp. TaxID=260755 RepID=UPI0026211558|nr:bifunctional 3-(3-hydroxy-phenyl)propionate/3-hydroxycinnamic acid hydroxylase [uncultured Ramlibacter sp.]
MAQGVYDVAIAGFGPSGAVAAGLLGGMGLRVFVCDRSHEVYDKPRAFALDHEIMRVFQQLGVAEQVLEFTEPFTPSEFYGVEGQLIKRFSTAEPPYPLGFTPSLVFSQPHVEQVVREHVASLSNVDIALGTTLTGMAQDADQVRLQLAEEDGTQREVRARYAIGCDGASSTLRGLAGIALEDLGFDQPWLVVDVLANEQGLAKLPKVSMQICEPQRPCTYLVGPNNHRRWEISINEGEDPKEVATPEGTWKLLSRWITPEDAVLWRQASYRFHALVADRWRAGRVFVAGDAAHQQPPFLGQGMCQGIRDVANLAWKLDAVLRGQAGNALLDSYGTERKDHVTALTTRIKDIGQLVGQRDLDKARARDARLLEECGGTVKSQPRQSVQPALAAGLLSPLAHAAVGSIFPQPWILRGGRKHRMDELAGRGWRLVTLDGTAPPATQDLRTVRIGTPDFNEAEGVAARWFAQQGCTAAIVRPDHYVWGVAQDAATLQKQLETLSQQRQPGDKT